MKVRDFVNCFLDDVYCWLCEPSNRCVEDYHLSLLDMCKAKSVEGAVRSRRMRDEVGEFLYQRLSQMDGWKRMGLGDAFISMATTIYIRNLCN